MNGELNNANVDATPEVEEYLEIRDLRTKLKSTRWNLFFVSLTLLLLIACFFQQKTLTEQTEKEAYLLSVVVTEYEDILLYKYGTTPNRIGLGELRDEWINNPCHETIFPYYTKLSEIVNMLEEGTLPDEPNNSISGEMSSV